MTNANVITQFRQLNRTVARKARCPHFRTKGAVDFWLHYVCRTKEDFQCPSTKYTQCRSQTCILAIPTSWQKSTENLMN